MRGGWRGEEMTDRCFLAEGAEEEKEDGGWEGIAEG